MIKVRSIAHVCREAMRMIEDPWVTIPKSWDDLNDRQRRMSCFIVNYILANPGTTSEAVHNAWMGEMIHQEGWSHGAVLDEVAKTHPNLREFYTLDATTAQQYRVSIGIVRGMIAISGKYEPSSTGTPTPHGPGLTGGTAVEMLLTQEDRTALTGAPSDADFIDVLVGEQVGPSEHESTPASDPLERPE